MKNPRFESDPLLTDPYPAWIEELPVHMVNAHLARIMQFYVFSSPCKTSWGRISMDQRGWTGNYWSSDKFRPLILRGSTLTEIHSVGTATELQKKWPYADSNAFAEVEFAYAVDAGEECWFINLLHRIRNAFAHGRFRINGDGFFYFEDVDKDGRTVKARICLNQTTLENWIEIIKGNTVEAKDIQTKMKARKKTTKEEG